MPIPNLARSLVLLFVSVALAAAPTTLPGAGPQPAIYSPLDASPLELLAARELRRYVAVRTGEVLEIETWAEELPDGASGFLVARADREAVRALLAKDDELADARAGSYLLRTARTVGDGDGDSDIVLAAGRDDLGTLYAAYRLAEHLGVRFFLHGDVVPDEQVALKIPQLDDRGEPLFELRGILPFHDFPEGPDWWNRDDWLAVISQLPKLRMNFIGLHTYPEGGPNAEPTVWIGLPEDVLEAGRVRSAYPSSYQNTLRGNWGYAARPTSEFSSGAAELFEVDAYSADVMRDLCPAPSTTEAEIELFHRVGDVLREAFDHAHRLGVETCVGTETPLTIPKRVRERLEAARRNPDDIETVRELYEGIFRRATAAYPLDYYWLWTPEGWTWQGATPEQVRRTIADLHAALLAASAADAPFQLATCGWVLGPQNDRALFDTVLPADVPVSCINREVGRTPIDAAFARIDGRPKWAIPWLEDDPALTTPQLWVGRMRRDARDAVQSKCTGLMGIHWRTRVLAPNVLALARAAWEQSWDRDATARETPPRRDGPVGGKVAPFSDPIDGTDDDAVYQSVRYALSAYHLEAPRGPCRVALHFCEPHYNAVGRRVFSVSIEGTRRIHALDIYATVGHDRALTITFDEVDPQDGWLDLEFTPVVEHPAIAGITVEGAHGTRRINCGGAAVNGFEADGEATKATTERGRLPVVDVYRDWALSEFGADAGEGVAAILAPLDGNVPRPADWVRGPGGLKPDARPWETVREEYGFVDEVAALRSTVRGPGNLERFDFWSEQFQALRATARVRCVWAEFNEAMMATRAAESSATRTLARERALPARERLVDAVEDVMDHLLASVRTRGDLGTIANWQQHILPTLLETPGRELEELLGEALPASARVSTGYDGPPRLIAPTVRTLAAEGETLTVDVIVLDRELPRRSAVRWRPLDRLEGGVAPQYESVPLEHVARGVWRAVFPRGGVPADGIEYHVEVETTGGEWLHFPVTAPGMGQTIVAMPARAGGP